jgi:hypothetical protein
LSLILKLLILNCRKRERYPYVSRNVYILINTYLLKYVKNVYFKFSTPEKKAVPLHRRFIHHVGTASKRISEGDHLRKLTTNRKLQLYFGGRGSSSHHPGTH